MSGGSNYSLNSISKKEEEERIRKFFMTILFNSQSWEVVAEEIIFIFGFDAWSACGLLNIAGPTV